MAGRYFIHDNGSRPFMVVIDGLTASVFRVLPDQDYHHDLPECYQSVPELTVECSEIFVGESPMCAMTVYSGGHGPEFSGNAILLQPVSAEDTGDIKYVWIGNRGIQSFMSLRITSFVSLVGNNDVPYPYTVDVDGNVRLLLDNVVLKPGFKFDLAACNGNPYRWFYDNNQLCEWPALDPGHVYIPGYDGILTHYHVDKDGRREQYVLRYCPNPAERYDRWAGLGYFSHMIVTMAEHGVIVEKVWTRQEFINVMNKFGREHGWEHFVTEEISPRFA